jgi:hypothetical protein
MPADHFAAVIIQVPIAFSLDTSSPLLSRFSLRKSSDSIRRQPKHVKVMDLAQNVLNIFKVLPPCLMQTWQEILNRVTESLYSNAQIMKRNIGPVAQRPDVEIMSLVPTLQSQMRE